MLSSLPPRILLKISGEMLKGEKEASLDAHFLLQLSKSIIDLHAHNVQVAIVLGGGNIFRGISGTNFGLSQQPADLMGMLATIINCIALQESLQQLGHRAHVMSAIPVGTMAASINIRDAKEALCRGETILFAGGTGNSFFTTDTAGVVRALEIEANLFAKATKVPGVFSKDPIKYSHAKRYESISYQEVLEKKLAVMDMTAIALAMTNKMPMLVFQLDEQRLIREALLDPTTYTVIT